MIVELLTWDFRVILQDYVAWTIGIAALIWGGGPERAVALIWLILFELLPGAYSLFDNSPGFGANIDYFVLLIDSLAAIAWIAVALYANRNYTLWIAAMQVLALCAHLASGIAEPISSIGYGVMVVAPSWIQLLVLAIGLVRHRLRLRKFGSYRDWRPTRFSPGSPPSASGPSLYTSVLDPPGSSWRDTLK